MGFFRSIFEGVVHCVASFIAAVLNHPSVQDAIANGIVAGMNAFALQPDLHEKARIMSETLSRSQRELARNAGEDFPVLIGNFLQGMIKPRRDKDGNYPPVQAPSSEGIQLPDMDSGSTTTDQDASYKAAETPPMSPHSSFMETTNNNNEEEKEIGGTDGLRRRSLQILGLSPKD